MKNVSQIKENIKYPELIKDNDNLIKEYLDMLIKTLWLINYYSLKFNNKHEYYKDFIKYSISNFNSFISVAGKSFKINEEKKKILLNSYVYLNLKSDEYNIKNMINIDYINSSISYEKVYDNSINTQYYSFKRLCQVIIENKYKIEKLNNKLYLDIKYFLLADYSLKLNNKEYLIFINNPFDTFSITLDSTGFVKNRNHLCKLLNLNCIDLDFNELKAVQKNESMEKLIIDYLELKLLS